MTPTELAIALNRKRAEETLTLIETLMEEPASPSRDERLQVLQDALGRYIMTAEMLETGMRVTNSKVE